MANVMDYMAWAKDQPFSTLPFNDIDNIALSQIVYLQLGEGFASSPSPSFREVTAALDGEEAEKIYELLLRQRLQLLRLMASGKRYGDLALSHYVDELSIEDEKQFCAMTLWLPNGIPVLIYRGTDLSLVGWKENLNMAFQSPVPAQRSALHYLRQVAGQGSTPLILLGHSKGGNLAVYAASHCESAVRQRILRVYSNDGPGLSRQDVTLPGYRELGGRLTSLLPQGTLVGVLLYHHGPYRVIKSRGLGLFQHDPFSWMVRPGEPHFVVRQGLSDSAKLMSRSINPWMEALSPEERQLFVNSLYQVLTAGGSKTLGELVKGDRRSNMQLLKATRELSPEAKRTMRRCISSLYAGTWHNFRQMLREALTSLLPRRAKQAQK